MAKQVYTGQGAAAARGAHQLHAWKALQTHHDETRDLQLRELFAKDPARGERLIAEAEGIFLDYSKNRVTEDTLKLLFGLAQESGLKARIDAMFQGVKINTTENRAVLHVALRAPTDAVNCRRRRKHRAKGARGPRQDGEILRPRAKRGLEGAYRQAHSQRRQYRYRRIGLRACDGL